MQNAKYLHHTLGFILGGFHNMKQQPVFTENQMPDNGSRVIIGLRRAGQRLGMDDKEAMVLTRLVCQRSATSRDVRPYRR